MLLPKHATVFLIASAAFSASDPFVGTWKLDVVKSDFGPEEKPRGGAAIFERTADGYLYARWSLGKGGNIGRQSGRINFPELMESATIKFVWTQPDDNTLELSIHSKRTGTNHVSKRCIVSPADQKLRIMLLEANSGRTVQTLVYDKMSRPPELQVPLEIPAVLDPQER